MAATLVDWLATRSPRELAVLLSRRPEARQAPLPRDLTEVAERLGSATAVTSTLHRLPLPALQLIELLQLFGPDGCDRSTLAHWVGRGDHRDDASVDRVLAELAGLALVWPDGERLRMVEPLYRWRRFPLGLGAPAADLLARYPTEHVRGIARRLGLPTHGRRSDLVDRVHRVLCDHERVRNLVAEADPSTRDWLRRLAVTGPDRSGWHQYRHPEPALQWAAERGLVLADAWGIPQPPMEVAVALRGPGWHAPFTPDPPRPRLVEVSPDRIADAGAAAGAAAVTALQRLLATVDATPVTLRRAGGVGVRELRRLATATGLADPDLRLGLELAHEAGLVAVVPDRAGGADLLPTREYDRWAGCTPAEQLATVLEAWPRLTTPPTPESASVPPLSRERPAASATLRPRLLGLLAPLPPDRGVADPATLSELLQWTAPLALTPPGADLTAGPDPVGVTAALWREAELLGIIAHGALTPLGRALVRLSARDTGPAVQDPAEVDPGEAGDRGEDDASALITVCRDLLPAPTDRAVFQADLTALAPGFPTPELAALLDATADRESSGGGVTWRFSADSVRRALDAGWQSDRLLAALAERSASGPLPQALTYLVTDLARRHGAVRVRAVGCVLLARDPALLAQLVGARALRPLGLRAVAPTVATSTAPPERVLAELRAAGYAPVVEDEDGVPRLTTVERRRAQPRSRGGHRPAPAAGDDLAALADRLLAAPLPAHAPTPREPPNADPTPSDTVGTDPTPSDTVGTDPTPSEAAGVDPTPWQPPEAGRTPLEPTGTAPVAPWSTRPRRPTDPAPAPYRRPTDPAPASHRRPADPASASHRRPADPAPGPRRPTQRPAGSEAELRRLTPHLDERERELLWTALERDTSVRITYLDRNHERTVRVIDPLEVDRGHLVAWCHLRGDERRFALRRITRVAIP